MAMSKLIYGAPQALDVSGLNGLTNSPTVQWRSTEITNLGDRFEDASLEVRLQWTSGAPANSKSALVFVDGRNDDSVLETAVVATAQPDAATGPLPWRLLTRVPYRITGETVRVSVSSVAAAFGGVLPAVWRVIVVNYAGASLSSSGNSITWRGVGTEIV